MPIEDEIPANIIIRTQVDDEKTIKERMRQIYGIDESKVTKTPRLKLKTNIMDLRSKSVLNLASRKKPLQQKNLMQ